MLSDCGDHIPENVTFILTALRIQIKHTQGDSEEKINILRDDSVDHCYKKNSLYEHVCYS